MTHPTDMGATECQRPARASYASTVATQLSASKPGASRELSHTRVCNSRAKALPACAHELARRSAPPTAYTRPSHAQQARLPRFTAMSAGSFSHLHGDVGLARTLWRAAQRRISMHRDERTCRRAGPSAPQSSCSDPRQSRPPAAATAYLSLRS